MSPAERAAQLEADRKYWGESDNAELNALWQRACARAGRVIDVRIEPLEPWLDESRFEVTIYQMLLPRR